MKFTFKNFGNIDSGEVELADLTLICGLNNVGKTYISYAIYGFIKHFFSLVNTDPNKEWVNTLSKHKELKISMPDFLKYFYSELEKSGFEFTKTIDRIFSSPDGFFDRSKIDLLTGELNPNLKFSISYRYYYTDEIIIHIKKKENDKYIQIFLETLDNNAKIHPKMFIYVIMKNISEKLFPDTVFYKPFIMTSERTSISIFYKEIDYNRSSALGNFTLDNKSSNLSGDPYAYSRYAEPIRDNINTIRDYENINKHKSFLSKDKEKYHAIFDLLQEIMGGSFENKSNQVLYQPKKEKGRDEVLIPIYLSSSSIKSLFLMDLYINCLAQENGLLVIDEPELNLHPDNQRKMAGLLARLVNAGVKVLITTHSDYLIREINNRIMLSNDINNKEKIMEDNGLLNEDILNPKQVAAYTLDTKHKVNNVKVDKFGMNMEIFDDIIAQVNDIGDDIYYNIKG